MDLAERLHAAFQVEHREHLEAIRGALDALFAGGPAAAGALEESFRRAHTLKGAARAVGMKEVERLAHALETLFARLRDGTMAGDAPARGLARELLDAVEDAVAAAREGRAPAGVEEIVGRVTERLGAAAAPGRAPVPSERRGTAVPAVETVRIRANALEDLGRSARELPAALRRLEGIGAGLRSLERTVAEGGPGGPEALAREARDLRTAHGAAAFALRSLGERIAEEVALARMVPVADVFEGFRKMVRDLAADEGKEVELRVEGFELHADRLVLQQLKDPLMHVLRNAVSHGIERPEERERLGKSRTGAIRLAIAVSGGTLAAEVVDDGRGIDPAFVRSEAVKRGHLDAAQAPALGEEELLRVLLKPGFTTSPGVNELAGRGMGLAVAQDAAWRLQGEVDIRPSPAGGVSVRLSVPVTSALDRFLGVVEGGQAFAFPSRGIERVLLARPEDAVPVQGRLMLPLAGRPVPFAVLSHLLGGEEPEEPVFRPGTPFPVVVLRAGSRRLALAVEALGGEREDLVSDLGPRCPRDPRVSGAILEADGTVAIVLNPAAVIEGAGALASLRVEAPRVPEGGRRRILVVDDSITTRTLERGILEASGYQALLAVDGVEALQVLRSERVDLVLADIQMPRLDGFGLLAEMKKDPRLQKVPVVLVTSMEERRDKERGMSLGADAYVVKKKFDQNELLSTIEGLL